MPKIRVSKKQFIELLQIHKGQRSVVAEALGITVNAVSNRINRDPDIKAVDDSIREAQLDKAENKLHELIEDGHPAAIMFKLKCLGKDRGYIERQEITGKDGADLHKDKTDADIDSRIRELISKEKDRTGKVKLSLVEGGE